MQIERTPLSVSSRLDYESIAAAVNLSGRSDPGMRFARLGIRGSVEKNAARLRARDLLLDDSLRSFLTMPGLFFAFEWLLLQKREQSNVFHNVKKRPVRTFIAAIEREPHIYKAGIRFIPHPNHGHVKYLDPIEGARNSLQTPFIFRYHQIAFEDYARVGQKQDAAFLDFNGPLSRKRIDAIRTFWEMSSPKILIVNRMKGRSPDGWTDEQCQGKLIDACSGGRVVDDHSYLSFRQIAIQREVS